MCVLYCKYIISRSVLYFVHIISPLDRNFVLAKICVLVKIYVFNMDIRMSSLFYNVSPHLIYPIMHIPSCHHAYFIRHHRFFSREEDERRHWCWLVSVSGLVSTDDPRLNSARNDTWIFLKWRNSWRWVFINVARQLQEAKGKYLTRRFRSLISLN